MEHWFRLGISTNSQWMLIYEDSLSRVRSLPCGARSRGHMPTERQLCQLSSRSQKGLNFLEFVTDITADARWPRKAGDVVAVVAVNAHPPISLSLTLVHLPRRVAEELALMASPPLHISR